MSLAERDHTAPTKGQGMPCAMAMALRDLPNDEERAILQRWLDVPVGEYGRRSDRVIAEDLSQELGRPFGDYQVSPHRNRICRCFRGQPK